MTRKTRRFLKLLTVGTCAVCLTVFGACQPDKPITPHPDDPDPTPDPTTEYVQESEVSVTGNQTGFVENGKYRTDYGTLEEERAAAKQLNIEVASEGDVLMKNDDNTLPLKKNSTLTLLGYKTNDIMMGGGGSGSGRPGQYGVPKTTLEMGLKQAGFDVNPATLNYYSANKKEIGTLPASVQSTYKDFNDAAIVMFSRSGSEGRDENTYGVDGDKHYLEFTDVEKQLIKHAKANFDKVILLVNSSNAMELSEVNAEKTKDNLGVDAILWIGHVGNDGAAAIGKILNGEVNPSGRTADTYAVDFTKDPTFTNFGNNGQNVDAQGNRLDTYIYEEGKDSAPYTMEDNLKGYNFFSVEYREGIYVGYKYYETKAAIEGGDWFKNNVVYPFGYGLSYTTFSQEITDDIAPTGTISKANSTVTVKVKVTNTGSVAGKDVVQLYYTAPYTDGGIEKAEVNLAAFAKTDMLQPGESQTLTLQFVAQDMASFDWNDANSNDFVGYELEKGEYTISLRNNSHDVLDTITRNIESDIQCKTDYTTGAEIKPLFTGEDGLEEYKSTNDTLEANMMTRADGLQIPAPVSKEERTWSTGEIQELESQKTYYSYMDETTDPYYVSKVPAGWTQASAEDVAARKDGKTAVQLKDLFGVSYTEPSLKDGVATAATDEGTKAWDEYLNQLSWEELATIVSYGGFGQPEIEAIGKNAAGAYDAAAHPFWNGGMFGGAQAPENQMGTNWCTPAVWGCTWNVDLLAKIGRMTGNEALFFNIEALYGFSINIHRSPFGGRNFEYLSEDGLLTGKLIAAANKEVTNMGLVTYTKHFMMNNQETNRNDQGGVMTWATEQAIREIYGKGYEIAIKEGNTSGFMTAFNRIGKSTCSTNWSLLEGLIRNEWGFSGHNVTDYMDYAPYRYTNLMVRAGNELPLGGPDKLIGKGKGGVSSYTEGTWDAEANMVLVAADETNALAAEAARVAGGVYADCSQYEDKASPTQWFNVRKAAQRVLYSMVNGLGGLNGNDYKFAMTVDLAVNAAADCDLVSEIITKIAPQLSEGSNISSVVSNTDEVENLPAGLAFANNMLTGTPTAAGSFTLSYVIYVDGWAYIPVTVTVNVK